jgi:pimeloyl-ACP methyl ester carboxylesterase
MTVAEFSSSGIRLTYAAQGTGTPIVLLHGFIFSHAPAWIAGGLFDALSRAHRVVALDLRGHGASDKPHDTASYGLEMVNDIVRLMDHLRFDRAHVIGYSLGGILASKLLEVAPRRLRSVVLGGARWVREGDQTHRSWIPLFELLRQVRPGQPLSSCFWPNPELRPHRTVLDIVDANDPIALAAVARGMLDVTLGEEVLRSNRVPILAICGEEDPISPGVLALEQAVENLTIRIVPGQDHNTLPSSRQFREEVEGFVSRHD